MVIGSTGTVYQVTHDADGTRVSIVDSSGNVITTSDPIAGTPGSSTSVARPDGSLVVVTSNDCATRPRCGR